MISGKNILLTGGMDRKFKSMLECKSLGIKTYLINGKYPDRIRDIGKEKFVISPLINFTESISFSLDSFELVPSEKSSSTVT